jgi:hypothetical protein
MIVQYVFKITIAGIEDYKWCETEVSIDVEHVLLCHYNKLDVV